MMSLSVLLVVTELETVVSVDWLMLFTMLAGGLALFLYGMEKMSQSLTLVAGPHMRSILTSLSSNRIIGLIVGMFVTTVMQSSSASTVMMISLVQSGLMQFSQSLGLILGANIGSTITAQLVAFKLTDYALLVLAAGFVGSLSPKQQLRNYASIMLGFGMLFYGMHLMSEAMSPLRSYQPFLNFLVTLDNPIPAILIGAVFTAIIQSSGAFTGIVIALAQQQLVSLEAGIALIIGANIGTCATALLASIRSGIEAKRVAYAHVFFNLIGALIFVAWIPQFAQLVDMLGSTDKSSLARDIANAHTLFNVTISFVFLPFTNLTARFLIRLIPDRNTESDTYKHSLSPEMLSTPGLALKLAHQETIRMGNRVAAMIQLSLQTFSPNSPNDNDTPKTPILQTIAAYEDELDYLDTHIRSYLLQIGQRQFNPKYGPELFRLMSVVTDFESIGDIISRNLKRFNTQQTERSAKFSAEGLAELEAYQHKIYKQMCRITRSLESNNTTDALKVLVKEQKYLILENEMRHQHILRLSNSQAESIASHNMHVELMQMYKQVGVLIAGVATTLAIDTAEV